MAKQMENQGKRIESNKDNVHSSKRYLPSGTNHTNIQPKGQAKYYGLTFENKLSWRQHIIKKTNGPKAKNSTGSQEKEFHL
jgi:hypothetical protein